MSYNNKKDRVEEKVYSVTMTEEELSLFSEFLEQREFEYNPPEYYYREVREELENKHPGSFDILNNYVFGDGAKEDPDNPYVREKTRNNDRAFQEINYYHQHLGEAAKRFLAQTNRSEIPEEERKLAQKVVEKYSPRGKDCFEQFDNFYKDVDKRKKEYDLLDNLKQPDVTSIIPKSEKKKKSGQIVEDIPIIIDESEQEEEITPELIEFQKHQRQMKLKNSAIAAGATAALVGGGIALKKHLKKKKQEKELAESKYKTTKKDKSSR